MNSVDVTSLKRLRKLSGSFCQRESPGRLRFAWLFTRSREVRTLSRGNRASVRRRRQSNAEG